MPGESAEKSILELTAQIAELARAMSDRQTQGVSRRGPRLASYDGAKKGLAARQWLHQIQGEISGSSLTPGAALALARAHLEGRAATWYHFEHAEVPFVAFESEDVEDAATFCRRFTEAFVQPGCSASGFYSFRQSPDTPAESYVYEKVSLAQAAGISFEDAFDHVIQGLHEVLTPVKLAVSHHPSSSAVALVSDIIRAARVIGVDAERTPNELRSRPGSGTFQGSNMRGFFQSAPGRWREDPRSQTIEAIPDRALRAPVEPQGAPMWRSAAGGSAVRGAVVGHQVAPERSQAPDPSRSLALTPTCWGCNEIGHIRRDCPLGARRGLPRRENFNTKVTNIASEAKYLKECTVNGDQKVRGLMDTGCSAVLIRASKAIQLDLKISREAIPVYGTGDVSIPATHTLGRVFLNSLQVDEGVAHNVEALVLPDSAIPEDLCVGRTFLDLPHLSLLRFDEEFFVGPKESMLERIRRGTLERPRAMSDAEVRPGTVALVRAVTESSSAVVIRAREHDYMFHSDSNGVVELPVNNDGVQSLHIRAGEVVCECKVFSEEEIPREDLYRSSSSAETRIGGSEQKSSSDTVGCQRVIKLEEVMFGPTLSNSQKRTALELINEFKDVFSFNLQELGCTNVLEADIQLKPGGAPARSKPYRLAPDDREFMKTQIRDWKDAGIVSDTRSPFASPAFVVTRLVPGKSPKKRVVVDVRKLNDAAVDLQWPIPNIEDELMDLSHARCFAQLDFRQGFMQVPLSAESRPYTAFITPDSSGEFNRMMFGFKNGPAIFNHLVSLVLEPMKREKLCLHFFDDVLVTAIGFDQLLTVLRDVFLRLRSARLTLNPEKCRFGFEEVTFMGLVIKNGTVSPTEDKIRAIEQFRVPESATQVRQYLGLCGFFRRFIPAFAEKVAPLSALTSTKIAFAWGDSQQSAFENMKQIIRQPPVLTLFNPKAEIELHCDASSVGLAGMLLQMDESRRLHLVRCVSRKCSATETTYHSSRLELLAIIFALEKLRTFLLGRTFKLVTDCQALLSINTRTTRNPQLARWCVLMQEFQFTVEHRAGTRMAHVDALSRNPVNEPPEEAERIYCGAARDVSDRSEEEILDRWMEDRPVSAFVTIDKPATTFQEEILAIQQEDPDIRRRIEILRKPEEDRSAAEERMILHFELYRGCLFRVSDAARLFVVPDGQRKAITIRAHDLHGHFGVERTTQIIRQNCWFPRMNRYVRDHISRCIPCLAHRRKSGKQPGMLQDIPIPNRPFEWVHIDHVGPFPTSTSQKTHILVIVDRLTKFSYLEPVRNTSAKESVEALQRFIDDWGTPARITSDRGSAFTASVFREFVTRLGISHRLTCPRRPQGNGQVERVNGILTPLLAKLLHSGKTGHWDRLLKKVQLLLNTSVNSSTGETPIRLLCGFSPEVPDRLLGAIAHPASKPRGDPEELRAQARSRIEKAFREAQKYYDRRHVAAEKLRPGDIVWFSAPPRAADGTSRKFDPLFRGPMMVTRALDHDTYAIVSLDDNNAYSSIAHIGQLRRFGHAVDATISQPVAIDDTNHGGTGPGELTFAEISDDSTEVPAIEHPVPSPTPPDPPSAPPEQPSSRTHQTSSSQRQQEPRRTSRIPKKKAIFDPSF